MNQDLWHYDYLDQWNNEYYKDVFLSTHLTGDEIAVGNGVEREYFYVAKKGKISYLIPSKIIEDGDLPFVALSTEKTAFRNKAFQVIQGYKSVVIRAEQTMSYKQMIDSWMDYDHEEKDLFTLWKIIVDAAFCSRINVRLITYPGWMKDSVVFTLSRLRGSCFTVNKPSLGKLKFLLNGATKVLGLNEVQNLDSAARLDLAKFYEDIGDFKTEYINPTRSTGGTTEICKIDKLSTFTFSNFPDSRKSYENQKGDLFDNLFDPKIRGRIFPLLFKGGTEKQPACKQRFGHVTDKINPEQVAELVDWLRNHLYYEQYGDELCSKKPFKNTYFIKNNRWDRNFQAICERLKLYAETQEEYDSFVKLLYRCHKEYNDYIDNFNKAEQIEDLSPTASTFEKFETVDMSEVK